MKKGYSFFFVPEENSYELSYIPSITVYPVKHLDDLISFFKGEESLKPLEMKKELGILYQKERENTVDFADIKGHAMIKRALSIAAA